MSEITGRPLIYDATLTWRRFDNFFALYDAAQNDPILIYVIGETHHCYIGCVGCIDGKKGLASRYAKQYVNRSMAIFGLDASHGQPSFAGSFVSPSNPMPQFVERMEKNIQTTFVNKHGQANALFTIKGTVETASIQHLGNPPPFL